MEMITSIDFAILDAIQQIRCAFLDYVMAFFTYLGEAGVIWIVTGVVLLFFKKTRATGAMLLAALALSFVVGNFVIKPIVARPRPFLINTNVNLFLSAPSGYSFPSGHATTAAAPAMVLLLKQRKLGLIALPVALLIMFSRLYNYVHYPSDILCGIVLGVLSALLVVFIFRKTGLERKLSPVAE